MRLILILLVAWVAMAALQYALVGLLIVLVLSILWGAYAHPLELFGTLAFFLTASVITHHTVACLTLGGVLGFCWMVRSPATLPGKESTEQASAKSGGSELPNNDST